MVSPERGTSEGDWAKVGRTVHRKAKTSKILPPVLANIPLSIWINKGFPNIAYDAPNFFFAKYLTKGLHGIELVFYNSTYFTLFDQRKEESVLESVHELGIGQVHGRWLN